MLPTLAGVVAGAVHVFAGPDHLAALPPLAIQSPRGAWFTGLLWGFGHACGMLLVGLLGLALRGMLPMELVSSFSERLVGAALIAVGLWGLRRAYSHRLHAHAHSHDGVSHTHFHFHPAGKKHGEGRAHFHSHVTVGMGVLHGITGSGQVLGVLPALALPGNTAPLLYLLAFAAGSVAAMSGYTWMIGVAHARLTRPWPSRRGPRNPLFDPHRICLTGVSGAALVIGSIWLVL